MLIFSLPCPSCRTTWAEQLAARPDFSGRFEAHCKHAGVAATLRVEAGSVTHWTLSSCATEDAFHRQRAFLAGGEAGVRGWLEAEAAAAKAAGAN